MMGNPMIKTMVRTQFLLTSRKRAIQQARFFLEQYLRLSKEVSFDEGRRSVRVPPMLGVNEDMRNWSFYMILSHNSIVNRSISAIVGQLVKGEVLSGDALINPKTDVMPSSSAGEADVKLFEESVTDHLKALETLLGLRGTKIAPHPIFGDFNAHQWNCMFSFHLKIHYSQARYVVGSLRGDRTG